jgi:hypothetical protein
MKYDITLPANNDKEDDLVMFLNDHTYNVTFSGLYDIWVNYRTELSEDEVVYLILLLGHVAIIKPAFPSQIFKSE